MRGEEAVHLLGEVLDHVGALELAVDQDVEPHALLPGDRVGDEPRHGGVVAGAVQLALAQAHAQLANLARLRERARGGRRVRRQVEVGLGAPPLLAGHAGPQLTDLRPLDRWWLHGVGGGTRGQGRCPPRQGARLLARELEPGRQLLALHGDGEEHEAGRRDQVDRVLVLGGREGGARRLEAIGPHAPTVHHRHQVLGLGLPCGRAAQLGDGLDRHLHREPSATERLDRLGRGVAELDGHERGPRLGEQLRRAGVGRIAQGDIGVVHHHAQARLVELETEVLVGGGLVADPGPDGLARRPGEVGRIERRVDLAELDERVRAQDGPGGIGVAGRLAPRQRAKRADGPVDLRHDVVVVRVEPLRHLPRLALRRAAGESGEHVEGLVADAGRIVVRRDPQHQGRLEHLVVEKVVVDRRADGVALLVQVGAPQLVDAGGEGVRLEASRPGALERPLELAIRADARVAGETGFDRHGTHIMPRAAELDQPLGRPSVMSPMVRPDHGSGCRVRRYFARPSSPPEVWIRCPRRSS